MRLEIRVALAALAALCVALATVGGIYLGGHGEPDYSRIGLQPRVQLAPNKPDANGKCEYLEYEHIPAYDGNDRQLRVTYCNGDTGVWYFRPDHTLDSHLIWIAGKHDARLRAKYAADGKQVIAGFALRNDGSLRWKVEPATGGVIVATTYWKNHSVFAVEKRAVGSGTIDITYFYTSGHPWVHYVGAVPGPSSNSLTSGTPVMNEMQVWNDNGVMTMNLVLSADGTNTYTFNREDGTTAYIQHWGKHQWCDEGGCGDGNALLSVDIFPHDGVVNVRHIDMNPDSFSETKVTDELADGSKTVYTVIGIGQIQHIDKFDKTGKQVSSQDIKNTDAKIDTDVKLTMAPTIPDPHKDWQTLEQEQAPASP